jgi:hypothetical protein
MRLAEPPLLAWLAGVLAREMSVMLGRHPPVFAPSPGSGPAVCGTAAMAASFWAWLGRLLTAEASCRSCCSAMVRGPPSLLTVAASFSDTLVFCVPCSWRSPSGRVHWFPAPRLPEVP